LPERSDAALLNPGAWTHYSWAIRDALELAGIPAVEVHLSNVDEREEWRRFSVLEDVVAARFVGKGPEGYREALEFLVQGGK
jgi:3-dehydroquinate dehydratase II